MKPDFFKYLPSEITNDILSRLPIRTIAISKCVCKPWLHLFESNEFVSSHLAKSVPALAALKIQRNSSSCSCTLYEFEDGLDLEHHDLHYNPLTKFNFPHSAAIQGSANGLLLLHKIGNRNLYVCNPITRNYIELHYPEEFGFEFRGTFPGDVACGFGVSKITGQHKVVLMCSDYINKRYECNVHTLGTESWRRVDIGDTFTYIDQSSGEFFNGNLHWTVVSKSDSWISCFDIETEHFSTLATPPLENRETSDELERLCVLGDHLCLCDHTYDEEIVIWLMKEYGVDKSWTKQYVIVENPKFNVEECFGLQLLVYPIKLFKDGDILMLRNDCYLFYYSSKTKTAEESSVFEKDHITSIILIPSFLSLRSFGLENVISF